MQDKTERWLYLCQQAAVEQDSEKLLAVNKVELPFCFGPSPLGPPVSQFCGLTTVAQKPSLVIEQATSSYSFRSSELSSPSEVFSFSFPLKEELRYDTIDPLGTSS